MILLKKTKNGKKFFTLKIFITMFFLCMISVFYVWFHISLVQMGYEIRSLEVKLDELIDESERLQVRVCGIESPENISKQLVLSNMNLKLTKEINVVRLKS